MCPACREAADKWLHSNPLQVLGGGIKIVSHAAYDDSVAGVMANRRYRWQQWRDLVVFQMDLIRRICADKHGSDA